MGPFMKDRRFQDYSWDDQGFSVLSTFYHDLAVILDDKFRTAKCIVKQTEKSSKLNRAVWSYVQVEWNDFVPSSPPVYFNLI